jgi:hypothetical protein
MFFTVGMEEMPKCLCLTPEDLQHDGIFLASSGMEEMEIRSQHRTVKFCISLL